MSMLLRFQRFQLRATTVAVNRVRAVADGCNRVINTVSRPIRRVARQISLEGPWVIMLLTCTWISVVPLLMYPYVKTFILKDKRTLMEEERVRLCVQKGIDPYPYMQKKEFVYGNNFSGLAREEEYPLADSWEHRAMVKFYEEKEALLRETNGDVDATVTKLLQLREQLRKDAKPIHEPEDLIFRQKEKR